MMQLLGWILFGVGSFFLLLLGLIGVEGIGNIPGLLIGTSGMISGSVFIGSSRIVDAISGKKATDGLPHTPTPQSGRGSSNNVDETLLVSDADTSSQSKQIATETMVSAAVVFVPVAIGVLIYLITQ